MAEISQKLPELVKKWHQESQYIVVLSVKDEKELKDVWNSLDKSRVVPFYEPDLNNELTAIAVDPFYEDASKLLSNIPLAFQERRIKDSIVLSYNKAHNTDPSIPQWLIKHKGISHYVTHVEFKNCVLVVRKRLIMSTLKDH